MRMGFVSFGFALLLLCRLGKVGNRVVKMNKHAVSLVCIAAASSWLRKQAVSSLQSSYRRLWSALRGAPGEFEML